MKLYMTRHGETEWNLEGRLQGQLDSNLTDYGRTQAAWLSKRLSQIPLDVICSSTSGRAIETAEIIRGGRPLAIDTYRDLREIHFGPWEGQYHSALQEAYPEDYNNLWYHPDRFHVEGMESIPQVIERAGRVLENIMKKYPGKDVLIVAHALLLKGIYAYVKDLPVTEFWSGPFMKSTNLSIIEVEDKHLSFILEGDTSHYE